MDKERREKLWGDLSSPNCEACDMPGRTEVLALLDMADERDQLRALLERAWYYVERGGNPELLNAIDAALEGNDGD